MKRTAPFRRASSAAHPEGVSELLIWYALVENEGDQLCESLSEMVVAYL
jgi:hypothetical protein